MAHWSVAPTHKVTYGKHDYKTMLIHADAAEPVVDESGLMQPHSVTDQTVNVLVITTAVPFATDVGRWCVISEDPLYNI